MEEKKLVPKKRFVGHYDQWLKCRLKDFRDETDNYSYTGGPFGSDLKSSDYTKDGIRIIQLQNIGDGFFSNSYKIYTSKSKAESLSSNLIFPKDIIIAKMAEPLARAAIIPDYDNKYLMASDGIRLKVDKSKFNNYFILTLINHENFRVKAIENSSGTTRKRIGLVTLGNLQSYVPKIEEQQKIGEFFKVLDERIVNQEQKIAKVKVLKTAYLTEMFPQESETVPKRRFKGFEGEWCYYKLSEIANIIGGGTPSTANSDFWDGNIDWYSPVEIGFSVYANGSRKKITRLGLEKSSATILPANRTILFTSRAGIGDMAILAKDAATNQGFQSLVINEEVDTYFIYSMGYKIKRYALKNASGSTFLEVSGKILEEMSILLPSNEEQQKIGNFFKNLDNQIKTEEKKLDKLQKMKEAYLGEMFV